MAEEQTKLDLEQPKAAEDLTEEEADQALREMTAGEKPPEPEETPTEPPQETPPEPVPSEAAPEESKEQVPAEPEEDIQQLQMDQLQLDLQQAEQERDKFKLLMGTQGNQIGELRKTIERLQTIPPSREPEGGYEETAEEAAPRQPGPSQVPDSYLERLARMEEAQNQREIQAAYQAFLQDNRDVLPTEEDGREELLGRMRPIVDQEIKEYSAIPLQPSQMGKLARGILDTALMQVRRQDIQSRLVKARERKAAQVPKHRQVSAAAISGAGSKSASAPKAKGPEDMSAEEADAWLKREHGDGHRRDRRSPW